MSGKEESLTIDKHLQQLEESLTAYETQHFINHIATNNEIANILSITTSDELRKKTALECGEMAFALEQYSAYIQKTSNRQTAIMNWAEARLNHLLSDLTPKVSAASYVERKALATRQDHAAQRLYQLKRRAQSQYDSLAYLPARINGMAKALMSLQDTKRMYERKHCE